MSDRTDEALLPKTTVVLTYVPDGHAGGGSADTAPDDASGALQQGDRPYWYSRDWIGLYYQYVAVGVFLGSANPLMYPV